MRDLPVYILVTVVAVLVWLWAAQATRKESTIDATVTFEVTSATGSWTIQPALLPVRLILEGPAGAIRRVGDALSEPLVLELPPNASEVTLTNLAERIDGLDAISIHGVQVLRTEPASVTIVVDQMVTATVDITPLLPGITTTGQPTATPLTATVTMPASLRALLPESLVIEALVEPSHVEGLAVGPQLIPRVSLRVADSGGSGAAITIDPPVAEITFEMVARVADMTVDRVRVHVVTPPEALGRYVVTLQERSLSDVTISAGADLIAQIQRGDATVVAVVQLGLNDLESGVTSKAVSYFVASDHTGAGQPVRGQVGSNPSPPVVSFSVESVKAAEARRSNGSRFSSVNP